jgi:hypothetical protein
LIFWAQKSPVVHTRQADVCFQNFWDAKSNQIFQRLSIIADYVALNPDSTNVPFTWIKSHLESKHGISCRSISNFFVGILDEYGLEGGNRNRSIVIED